MTGPAFDSWLGHLPSHWIRTRFGQDVVINEGQVDPTREPWSSMVLVAPNHIESGTGKIISLETARDQGADSGKYRAKSGQVLYSKIRPALNKVAIAPCDCLCSADMYPVSGRHHAVDNRFLAYWMLARPFVAYTTLMSDRVKMPKVNREEVAAAPWTRPPLDEQRRIADFLDAETAQIDQLVRLRNLQVDKLAEALRSEAGRIPNPEWRPLSLRRIVKSVQTGTTPTDLLRPADLENVPWYTPAALGGNLDLNDAEKSVNRDDFGAVPRFPAESILIVGIGESLGKVADLDHEATGNQQLTAISIYASADRRFVLWRLFAAYEEIRAWAQYSRVRILNNEVLKSFKIPVPPLDQQVKVRKALDHRLREFIEFRDAATRFSLLANERRQALITAAVTGGITV